MTQSRSPRSPAWIVCTSAFLSACAGTRSEAPRATETAGVAGASSPSASRSSQDASEPAVAQSHAERREIRRVVGELDRTSERRARLVFLARTCGAPLALDVALIANDADLAQLADAVRAAVPDSADRAAAAWPIERAAWRLLEAKASDGTIAPELAGVLTRQGGEAARSPSAVGNLVASASGVEDLARRLVAQNRILLEAESSSTRSRAYDWLAARGIAPEGFDPFGPLAGRRAALLRDGEQAAKTPAKTP